MSTQANTVKKQPSIRCTGCGEHFPKKELIRILRTPEGEIVIDELGKRSGRGAYICPRPECLRKARKQRRLEASLECSIPDDVYKKLEEELNVDNR